LRKKETIMVEMGKGFSEEKRNYNGRNGKGLP
jgi:hypothetical protein